MKFKLILLFLVPGVNLFSQEFNFDFSNSLSDFIAYEERIGSTSFYKNTLRFYHDKHYVSLSFRREQEFFPDLIVSYFYQKEDSSLFSIVYQWDVRQFDKTSNNPQSKEFQTRLYNKFNEIKKHLETGIARGVEAKDVSKWDPFADKLISLDYWIYHKGKVTLEIYMRNRVKTYEDNSTTLTSHILKLEVYKKGSLIYD